MFTVLSLECSQFGDIYQEDFFIKILKNEVYIVKELPSHLKSLDMEAIGSLVCISQVQYCEYALSWEEQILSILIFSSGY